jgi:hypothetical protein
MTAAVGSRTLIVAGAASLAVRQPVTGPRSEARMIAARPTAVYLELPPSAAEPRVLVLTAAGTSRPPNAIAISQGGADPFVPEELAVRVLRWWDPSPVLGPLSRARLEQGAAALHRACSSADRGPSLAGHDDPAALAACCADGDLAGAVEAAERIVGLGPGLAPSGDNMISGLLLALRLLGGAIPGGTRAVWLADWLGAAVTSDASRRTTSLGATLLHGAAHGQATDEVAAVLRGLAGQEPFGAAARTLLASGQGAAAAQPQPNGRAASTLASATAQPSGADLAWGLVAGCSAALALALPPR